jgi:hypothetical protein
MEQLSRVRLRRSWGSEIESVDGGETEKNTRCGMTLSLTPLCKERKAVPPACTFAVEATGGNYAVAQALLRHKSMVTTLNIYKKAISTEAFKEGMLTVQQKALSAKNMN